MSRGPVLLQPVSCSSLELKDLADLHDFELKAEIGATFGFEYLDTGLYKRKEIDVKKTPKLEHLRNVDIDVLENYYYKLLRENNKWFFIPVIDWEIQFVFQSPRTFHSKRTFRKTLNSGPTLISLVPGNNSRNEIEIEQYEKSYLLRRKDSVTKESVTDIHFIPQMKTHETFTMVFELIVKERLSPVVGVSGKIMEGITVSWQRLDQDSLRVIIFVQKTHDGYQATSTNNKVTVSPDKITQLMYINITHLDLIAFYYTEKVLSSDVLRKIFNLNI